MSLRYIALLIAPVLPVLLAACEAPPSVQQAIERAEAEEAAAIPETVDPVVRAARQDGREVYNLYLTGKWSPNGTCASDNTTWEFKADSFARPDERACRLEVIEALQDGSYAVAGYCPRLETEDEPEVFTFTRQSSGRIVIPGVKGGPLQKCL